MKYKTVILFFLIISSSVSCKEQNLNSKELESETFTLVAVGDIVHPHNWRDAWEYKKLGRKMFEPTRDIIKSGNISFANIEAPITKRKPILKKYYPFAMNPIEVDHAIWAGFNLFSLANNHIYDAGKKGIVDTLNYLNKKNISPNYRNKLFWAGTGLSKAEAATPKIFIIPKTNIKAAFFAYNGDGKKYSLVNKYISPGKKAIKDISSMKNVQIKIVSIHYGKEFEHIPRKYIVKEYRSLIDAGADIILAHHPHVAQGVEKYKNGLIFYSLGDFSFGPSHKRYNHPRWKAKMYNMLVRIKYKYDTKLKPTSVEIMPLYTDFWKPLYHKGKKFPHKRFTPRIVPQPFAKKILDKIILWSKKIPQNKTNFYINENILHIKL